jgi:hypothetical protein
MRKETYKQKAIAKGKNFSCPTLLRIWGKYNDFLRRCKKYYFKKKITH